ncbi:hypothetical protein ABE530_05245 [Brucella sp. TWI559]
MADNFDKFYPDWVVGTLTLTSGSRNFVATDAQLLLAGIREGDTILTPGGLVLPIESINADGSGGVLAQNAPVSATFTTRIRFQSDNSRFTGMLAALVARMSGGNLQAFAGLLGAHDKMPIFTGPGTLGLVDKGDLGIQDPNGSLEKLAALTLSARQLLQTDDTGALKAIALLANKALVTDENKDLQQIDLGTLGRALLALTAGTNAQYVQGDGTLQEKSALPVSTPVQAALDGKANLSGANFNGTVSTADNFIAGGSAQGKLRMKNTAGIQVFELGVAVGTGYGDAIGYYTNISSGSHYFYTNGAERLVVRNNGTVSVNGALSKGSGTFLIDHPLDPYNKNLRHGFVESTEYVNLYRGMVDLVDGRMTVDIDAAFGMTDGTFAALNADVMVSSLQNQYGPERVWVEGPADSGKFTIICEDAESTATIAWTVTGRRNDAFVLSDLDPNTDSEGRFVPEFEKEDA